MDTNKVRENITELEIMGVHGIKFGGGSGMAKLGGSATQCTFCEGEKVIQNLDLVVPKTGGHTCRSIKKMADGEMKKNGSTSICETLKKEEKICCPEVYEKGLSFDIEPPSDPSYDRIVAIHQVTVQGESDGNDNVTTSHPPILYGHVHMAKTGGTSLNGVLANTFERVCGHKGYSYDAFQDNERAKMKSEKGETIHPLGRSIVMPKLMKQIGFEECDYISQEDDWTFWRDTFGGGKFHGLKMELHVPCRDRLDHLMSQCNFKHRMLACDAKTDEELFKSVKECYVLLNRYDHQLKEHFDVRCFDFKTQFTDYPEYMSGILQKRRFQSTPYVQRVTNGPRNQTNECIWGNATVSEKVEKYLLETVPYYQFCDKCMGSENEIFDS